jgi:hypothetical protein
MHTSRGSALLLASFLCATDLITAAACDARLFHISKGTVVLDHSALNPGEVASEIFGFIPNTGPEPGSLIFADGLPDETIHFVEWEMPQSTTVGRLRVSAAGDGCNSEARTFDHVRILAEVDDQMLVVVDEDVIVPYQYETTCGIVLSQVIPLVTATRFRIEFTQHLSQLFSGPRIYEVEGFRFAGCGDPSDDNKVTASDALLALQTSVGTKFCENCICDVNNDGSTTASDALRVLRIAVGSPAPLECPVCPMAS